MAFLFDRPIERQDDLLLFRIGFERREVLLERLSRDGESIAMKQSGGKKILHHRHDAADVHQLGHQETPAGLEVGENRHALADTREVVEREIDARRVRDRQKMEDAIRRAAERDGYGDRIFKRFLGKKIRRADAAPEHVDDGGTRIAAILDLVF